MFIQVVPPADVEVVVPVRTPPRRVEAFVAAHRDWIRQTREAYGAQYVGDREVRPSSIRLPSTGNQLSVTYRHAPTTRQRIASADGQLTLSYRDPDLADVPQLLRRWLLSEAKRVLTPWLSTVADEMGRHPKRVQTRLQRTRWGSCSSSGTISLNGNLIFLRPELVRYLLVHELAHLTHMNHSSRFWARVARYEPRWRSLDQELSQAWQVLPWWALRCR